MSADPLLPVESMTLTVARGQLKRGENPEINVTTMLVMTIERLIGERDEEYSLTRLRGQQ